jgi:mRNA interferase HigB
MRVIKPTALKGYYAKHADAQAWLKAWLVAVEQAQWQSLNDVRKLYKNADTARADSGNVVTIFDVKGDRYRLIVAIHYNTQRVYVRDFMTHEEYNGQRWKKRH